MFRGCIGTVVGNQIGNNNIIDNWFIILVLQLGPIQCLFCIGVVLCWSFLALYVTWRVAIT